MNARRPPGALALAALFGLTATLVAYALLRAIQAWSGHAPDPTTVYWSQHAGFFWRAWTAGYLGGGALFAGWIAARRAPERVAAALVVAVPLAAIVFTATVLALP